MRTTTEAESIVAESAASGIIRHGINCKKEPHTGTGHLHGENDDGPYDVDGVMYCGRCHHYVSEQDIETAKMPGLIADYQSLLAAQERLKALVRVALDGGPEQLTKVEFAELRALSGKEKR